MKKYTPRIDDDGIHAPGVDMEIDESGDYYLVTEADARIDEITGALRSCLVVLELQRNSVRQFQEAGEHAIGEANRALALMGS
jgi:hypothetical protein